MKFDATTTPKKTKYHDFSRSSKGRNWKRQKTALQLNFYNIFTRPSQTTEKKIMGMSCALKANDLELIQVKRKILSKVQVLHGNFSSSALFSLRQQDTT